jgi:potassium-transporting ATPase KdpC subunit
LTFSFTPSVWRKERAVKHFRTSLAVLVFWTLVAGGVYPLLVWGLGAAIFPHRAAGSLVSRDGAVVGSALIGQDFSAAGYFHPRPSAITYDASSSGASNQGYTSKGLKAAFDARRAAWDRENGPAGAPMDMLFASGSGLDPHISPQAAEGQAARVAAARGVPAEKVLTIVRRHEEGPQAGFLGEPRVNVLSLNLALDAELTPAPHAAP